MCDNVRRTLSRFLHIQHGVATKKFTPVKLKGLGHTLETFNDNLRKTIKSFGSFLEEIKKTEGGGNMEGLLKFLLNIVPTLNFRFGECARKTIQGKTATIWYFFYKRSNRIDLIWWFLRGFSPEMARILPWWTIKSYWWQPIL